MSRSFSIFLVFLVAVIASNCVRTVTPPISPLQTLLMSRPWYLSYTDSIDQDSMNHIHDYHIPATACQKLETISLMADRTYTVKLICNQSSPGNFHGTWNYDDSTIAYFSSTDSAGSMTAPARILFVTDDSLQIDQPSNFATPDTRFTNYFQTKTYSH
jgi:hypothetical protein